MTGPATEFHHQNSRPAVNDHQKDESDQPPNSRERLGLWSGLQFLEAALAPALLILPFVAYFCWDVPLLHLISWWLLGDLVTFWPPVLYGCIKRKYSVWKAITSYPLGTSSKSSICGGHAHVLARDGPGTASPQETMDGLRARQGLGSDSTIRGPIHAEIVR